MGKLVRLRDVRRPVADGMAEKDCHRRLSRDKKRPNEAALATEFGGTFVTDGRCDCGARSSWEFCPDAAEERDRIGCNDRLHHHVSVEELAATEPSLMHPALVTDPDPDEEAYCL